MVGTNLRTMLNNNSFAVVLSACLDVEMYDLELRNKMATDALVKALTATGLRYMPVTGVYKGVQEQSFIVFCNNVFDVMRLEVLALDGHNQECVLVLDLEHDCAVLKYTEQVMMIGRGMQEVDALEALCHDAYTIVDGEYWIVL